MKSNMKRFRSVVHLSLLVGSLIWGTGQAAAQLTFSDTLVHIGPGDCAPSVSANYVVGAAVGAGSVPSAIGTAFLPAAQASSSAAATDTISCDFHGQTRQFAGKGLSAMAGVAFFYGVTTTTATSESAPACVSITMPAPGTSETASTAAGTSIAVTSIPVVGSANLTAVSAGQFYTTYLVFTTPPSLPVAATSPFSKVVCAFAFGQTAGSAMAINSPGGIAFATNTIAWMKRHGHDASVDAMMHEGISHETAELIYVNYVPASPKGQQYLAEYFLRHPEAIEPMNAKVRWPRLFIAAPAVVADMPLPQCLPNLLDPCISTQAKAGK